MWYFFSCWQCAVFPRRSDAAVTFTQPVWLNTLDGGSGRREGLCLHRTRHKMTEYAAIRQTALASPVQDRYHSYKPSCSYVLACCASSVAPRECPLCADSRAFGRLCDAFAGPGQRRKWRRSSKAQVCIIWMRYVLQVVPRTAVRCLLLLAIACVLNGVFTSIYKSTVSCKVINHLKSEAHRTLSSYLKENIPRLHYKDNWVKAV
jgi:hypothetical protein